MGYRGVTLVTGASSGIGRAIARLLAQRGYAVFGTSRHPESVEPIPGARLIALDVRSDESVAACVGSLLSNAGRLDILINNAGYSPPTRSQGLRHQGLAG